MAAKLQASLAKEQEKTIKTRSWTCYLFGGDVTLGKELDSGAFGTVYLANYTCTKEMVVSKETQG